jgi:hypothetical protein
LFSALLIVFGVAIALEPSVGQSTEKFKFALIGDMPYNSTEEAQFLNLIRDINASKVAFVIHDGDFKSGSSLCSDEMLTNRKELFNRFEHPFIYILGDNDWTDCHRENNGSYDPIERLARVRELYTVEDQSLGRQPLPLTRQSETSQYSKFRENVRWTYGNIMFVGFNIPGSNNNLGRTPAGDAEYQERNAANLIWMGEAFDLAKRNNNLGIVLIIQANPLFEKQPEERTGFNDFITALEAETREFDGQVVLVHGDTHYFRMDKPLPTWEEDADPPPRLLNFTRVETFGSPDIHWLRGMVDPENPNLFEFKQEIVKAN